MENKLDETDIKIINALRDNSRISMTLLGKQVFLTSQAVKNRVERLQDMGIVKRYTINISCPVFGFTYHALYNVKPLADKETDLIKAVQDPANHVIQCYQLDDGAYQIDAQFKTKEDGEKFTSLLQNFGKVAVHPVKKEVGGLYTSTRCACGCGM